MATTKQKKALDKMVENGGVASRAMIDAGYSELTAKTPSKLTESKGFKELLKENGLTEEFITKALVEDIENKPGKRFMELGLGAEILGMKKKEATNNNLFVINVPREVAEKNALPITSTDSEGHD